MGAWNFFHIQEIFLTLIFFESVLQEEKDPKSVGAITHNVVNHGVEPPSAPELVEPPDTLCIWGTPSLVWFSTYIPMANFGNVCLEMAKLKDLIILFLTN